MLRAGCLTLTQAEASRRDFLKAGSLGFLGIHLSQFLAAQSAMAATGDKASPKAQACVLVWLEGGPSHVDTWDPKPNSAFKPISTNVAGIQVSELLPKIARHMDKLAIIRSIHTEGNDHPQASHYALTGHKPNAAMQFPSFGSIVTKELGSRNRDPPYVLVPQCEIARQYEDYFKANFIGAQHDPMTIAA